ncbi:MAG: hypothetical protein NTU85_02060 [Candidatus Kaiserbacteria bacterium]|nr:hypothetical protein [Candidatus Kaiserbacteria bacterium]
MEQKIDIERAIRDHHKLIEISRKLYDATPEILCPYFKSNVSLTSDGFNHLLHKPNRQPRNIQEQKLKLRLLKHGLAIISNTGTLQEYRTTLEKYGTPGRDGFSKTKQVEYWGFHNIVGKEPMILIRIIIRRIGDGKLHFWSVMPIGKIGKQKLYRNDVEE